jgi:hypothetical protein
MVGGQEFGRLLVSWFGWRVVSSSTLSYAVYAVCLAVVMLVWGLSHWRPGLVARPAAFGSILAARPIVRVVVTLAVMWLGWHLFAR